MGFVNCLRCFKESIRDFSRLKFFKIFRREAVEGDIKDSRDCKNYTRVLGGLSMKILHKEYFLGHVRT